MFLDRWLQTQAERRSPQFRITSCFAHPDLSYRDACEHFERLNVWTSKHLNILNIWMFEHQYTGTFEHLKAIIVIVIEICQESPSCFPQYWSSKSIIPISLGSLEDLHCCVALSDLRPSNKKVKFSWYMLIVHPWKYPIPALDDIISLTIKAGKLKTNFSSIQTPLFPEFELGRHLGGWVTCDRLQSRSLFKTVRELRWVFVLVLV